MNYIPAEDKPEENSYEGEETIDEIADPNGSEPTEGATQTEVEDQKATRKPFKKKGISKAKYNLLFYGSIGITIFVIAVIAIDLATGVNIVRAVFTGEWGTSKEDKEVKTPKKHKVKPQKSAYENTLEYANFTIQKYDEGMKLSEGKPIAEVPEDKVSDVRKKIGLVVSYYMETMKRWYTINTENIRGKGYEEGDLAHKTDDKLTQAIVKIEKIIKELRANKDWDYLFNDRGIKSADENIDMLKEAYQLLLKEVGQKTPADLLEEMGTQIDSKYAKRTDYLSTFNGYCMDISDLEKDSAEYKETLLKLEETGKKYFRFCWSVLFDYYKYMKYAKDNKLTPDENVIRIGKTIETSTFDFTEKRLKDNGLDVDRNTEFAEDMRASAEQLKAEVGDYGQETEEEDSDTKEENKSYANEDR